MNDLLTELCWKCQRAFAANDKLAEIIVIDEARGATTIRRVHATCREAKGKE